MTKHDQMSYPTQTSMLIDCGQCSGTPTRNQIDSKAKTEAKNTNQTGHRQCPEEVTFLDYRHYKVVNMESVIREK